MSAPVLEVRGLEVELADGASIVSEVSFSVARGEIVGLVGESGSGKTTTALALLGYSRPGARKDGPGVTPISNRHRKKAYETGRLQDRPARLARLYNRGRSMVAPKGQ